MPAVIELSGISKRYGATQALADVDLVIERGSVHALVGENGAGKSTLGKVIAGVITPDSGEYRLAGQLVAFGSPRQALDAGVTMMAQELSLVPGLSTRENVYLGMEPHTGPFVRSADIASRFATLVDSTGIHVPADAPVAQLPISDQQKVEILRAVARDSSVIVMDEPTARLTGEETDALRHLVRRLTADGRTVVFVSHFLTDVLDLADTVTVMRDGRVVRTGPADVETEATLIEGMTGRTFSASFPERRLPPPDAEVVLSAHGLTRDGMFAGIDLDVRAGEIVAITGLVGSGRSEVLHAIYGDIRCDAGEMTLAGTTYAPRRPVDALRRGFAIVPESRKDQGLFSNLSVEANITMPFLRMMSRFGLTARRVMDAKAREMVDEVGIKTRNTAAPVMSLSGGNQQKVLFARALVDAPLVLLADEPTRGVDVAAKRSIYDLIVELASAGMGVLMVSSETEEVLGLAHRIVVMHEGRIVAELDGSTATEEQIMNAAFTTARRVP